MINKEENRIIRIVSLVLFSFEMKFRPLETWGMGIIIFRSARASCTTSGEPVRRNENLDTYIQAYMPHESSGDSSNQPIGHMGSPGRLP